MAETTGQPQQIGTCSTCGWPLREGCAHFCSTGSARIQQTFGVPVAAKDAEIAQLRSENERLKEMRDSQINYSIKLQQLLESLKREDTPHPELHHYQMVISIKAENAALREKVAALEAFAKKWGTNAPLSERRTIHEASLAYRKAAGIFPNPDGVKAILDK